jgi:hypothetical protein
VELKLNVTRQLLAHADDVNLLGHNIDTIKKNTETLIYIPKVSLEMNVEKTKHMLPVSSPECRSKLRYENSKHHLKLCYNSNIWEQQ